MYMYVSVSNSLELCFCQKLVKLDDILSYHNYKKGDIFLRHSVE